MKILKHLWELLTFLIKFTLISAFVLFLITIFAPDKVVNAVEVIKGLLC